MKKIVFFMSVCFLVSCNSDDSVYEDIDTPNDTYQFIVPENFPQLKYTYAQNPLTTNGIELGRKLFYEGRLSSTNQVSCAFCHEQSSAFTHHGHDLSHGVNDLIGKRNTPAIQNLAFLSEYFYDGASSNLEMVPIVPIHNELEMNETLPSIISKLQNDPKYVKMFANAFEDKKVSSKNMLKALAQFMTVMISSNSKYDKYVRNEEGGGFSDDEKEGKALFNQKCAACHATDLFTDFSFRNNGLPVNPRLNDLGREEVSGNSLDRYKFKVPSLRNVALTAPYMHDGRFGSLESVLNFYNDGMVDSQTIDPLLKNNHSVGLSLSSKEKKLIIQFLNTLTDFEFIQNPKYKNPE